MTEFIFKNAENLPHNTGDKLTNDYAVQDIPASFHAGAAKFYDAQGVKVFIAAAGCAAHLAGVVASYTVKPVIGIPIESEPLKGIDALLSTVQMPGGVPVATMAVNGAKNAALFAVEILALSDKNFER